jgi:hypothetical protein
LLGSGWLWIYKTDCKGTLKNYCDQASETITYSYYDGTINGVIGKSPIKFNNVESPDHHYIIVDSFTELMNHRILGLSHTHSNYQNFLGQLKENKLIDEIAFSLFRNPINVNQKHKGIFDFFRMRAV